MKEKVVVDLNQKEQIELERIVIDEDEAYALRFLKEVIKAQSPKSFSRRM